jgi:hypothetical protein
LQSLTKPPSTTTTEIYQSTHKGHKTKEPPNIFTHPRIPFPAALLSATFTNFPNVYI